MIKIAVRVTGSSKLPTPCINTDSSLSEFSLILAYNPPKIFDYYVNSFQLKLIYLIL